MHKRYIAIGAVCLSFFVCLCSGIAEEVKIGGLTIETKEDNSFILKSDGTKIIQSDYGEISLPGGAPINFIKDGKTQVKEGKDMKKVILTWEKPETGYFQRKILLFPKECIILWTLKVKLPKEGKGNIGLFIPEELVKNGSYKIISDHAVSEQEAMGKFADWEKDTHIFIADFGKKTDTIWLGSLELYTYPRINITFTHSKNVGFYPHFLLQKAENKYCADLQLPSLTECQIQAGVRIRLDPEEELWEGKNVPEGLLQLADEGAAITLFRDKRYLLPGEKIEIWAEYISEEEKAEKITLSYQLTDYYGRILKEGSYNFLTASKPINKIKFFEYQPKETGMYRLKVSYFDPGKKIIKEKQAIFAAFPESRQVTNSFFGTHGTDSTAYEECDKIASDVGSKWVRSIPALYWSPIEPEKGKFQFKKGDDAVKSLKKHGLKILHILDGPPPWVKGYTYGGPKDKESLKQFLPDYLEYVKQIVTRYKGKIDAYEVLNEACIGTITQEKADAYFQVLKETYKLIKSIDPNAIVVGIDGSTNLDPYYKLIRLGVLDYLDVVASHYVIPLTRTPDYGKRTTYTPKWYDALREIMRKYGGKEKPIWDSEDMVWLDANFYEKTYNYGERDINADWKSVLPGTPNYVEVTNRIVKFYLASISTGVKCFYFTGFHPIPMWWSLLEEDLTPTPAVVAYSVMANLIDGDACQKIIVTPNLQVFVFQREDGKVITAFFGYNLEGEKDAKLSLPVPKGKLQLINIMGNELPVSGDKNETILSLSDEPGYIINKGLSLDDIISGFEQAKVTGIKELAIIEEPVKDAQGGGIWNLEEGKGTVIKDSTPNHNDGTISGATWIRGDFGSALEFDGTDDYVEIPHSKSLNITNEITVAVWGKPEINTNHGPMMVKGPSIVGPSYSYRIATAVYADKPEVNAMTWGVSTLASENFMGMDPAPELKKWHYYVLTAKAGGPTKLYVDGKLLQNWPVSPESYLNSFPGYPVRMGMTYDGRYKYKGLIGESKILSRILSEEEVARDYQDNSIKYK